MAQRNYKRDKNGRFASSGNAVTTTTGRAGGFANQQFRSKVQTDRQAAAAQRSRGQAMPTRQVVRQGATAALMSPAVRRVAVAAAVPAVATALNAGFRGKRGVMNLATRSGRDRLQLRQNQRSLARLLAQERTSRTQFGRRAIVARPIGGGSKSGRPTYRYAKSTIRPASARLRASDLTRSITGRKR